MPIISGSSGGGAGAVVLFNSTLGADATNIDTGANGIATGYNALRIYVRARTDRAAQISDTLVVTFNADTGNNYMDSHWNFSGAGTSGNGGQTALGGPPGCLLVTGASAPAGAFAQISADVVGYTDSFHKVLSWNGGVRLDTANPQWDGGAMMYVQTTAISRMKIAPSGGTNLIAGSRLLILGL